MEELGKIAQLSLVRYFNVLEKTGYMNDSSVNKLILLQFLNDFLNGFLEYITDSDYQTIGKILSCLTDTSCLIPYNTYKEARPIDRYYVSNTPVRVTEDILNNEIRVTESGVLRTVEQYKPTGYWQPNNNSD